MPNMSWYTPSSMVETPYDNNGLLMQLALQRRAEAAARGENTGLLNQLITDAPLPSQSAEDALAQRLALAENPSIALDRPTEPSYISAGIPGLAALLNKKPAGEQTVATPSQPQVEGTASPGAAAETQSKSALDSLMAQLAAHRQAKVDEDKSQMWMNFFSKMASNQSSSLGGALAEGAATIAPTIQAQRTANSASEEKALEDQIALEKYKQEYGLKDRATTADEEKAKAAIMEAGSNAGYKTALADSLSGGGINAKTAPSIYQKGMAVAGNVMLSDTERAGGAALAARAKSFMETGSDLSGAPLTAQAGAIPASDYFSKK